MTADPQIHAGMALKGIRVLDFTWIHAGPSATRILSDQGAEVIKVESNQALAVVGGPASRTARGLGQRNNWNAGKLSISLNMKTPEALGIAKTLVSVCDVVAENFSGRVMPGWGMDYDNIRRIRPDAIMLSMSGFGRTGPWMDRVSYGQTLQAISGFTHLTGFPGTDPSGPASAYSDAVGGMAGAQAVLLALIHRSRTGQGQWIDLSQFESLSALLDTLILETSAENKSGASQSKNPQSNLQRRNGNRLPHGGGAPHGVYRCQGDDRWIAITVFTEKDWSSFVGATGNPHWAKDERFASMAGRQRHADELDGFVESWSFERTAEEAMAALQAAGVPAGVVQTGADLAHDAHLQERGFFRTVPDAKGEMRKIEGAPYKLSRTPGGVSRGAPEFGADQTYVLREVLGMTDDELADCAIAGVFE